MILSKLVSLTLLTAALALPLAAKADLIGTYTLTNVTVSGATGSGYLTGAITFDANSLITGQNIVFHNTTTNSTYSFTNHVAASSPLPAAERKDAFNSNSVNLVRTAGSNTAVAVRTYSNLYLAYSLTGSGLSGVSYDIDTTNGSLIDIFSYPPNAIGSIAQFRITGGSLTGTLTPNAPPPTVPSTPTPEPSSLLLLSTGIATLAAAARKRLRP